MVTRFGTSSFHLSLRAYLNMRFRLLVTATATALIGSFSLAAWAQESPANLIAGGGFEAEGVSLRLPEVSPFPLVMGGWGARADDAGAVAIVSGGADRGRVLELASTGDLPAFAIQDVPLAAPGFVFRAQLQRQRGRQTIAILGAWDRMDPVGPALIRLSLRGGALRITTPAGTWPVAVALDDRDWHNLEIVSDPRENLVSVRIDGLLRGSFPGAPAAAPRTVVVGGGGAARSTFRYDEISLQRLAEVELAGIAADFRRDADPLHRRTDAALLALETGSTRLVAVEVRAIGRALDPTSQPELSSRVARLLELLESR